ncbi:MAG: hypothetical protein ABIO06_04150 [Pseudolysinimonas sp.]
MVRAELLLVGLLAISSIAAAPATAVTACTVIQINAGTCSVDGSVGADDVTLIGNETLPGGGSASKRSGHTNPRPEFTCQIFVANRCLVRNPRSNPVTPVQPVTLRDIASFRPAPGVQYMEPNGWVVPGLDANFYSVVGQQLVNGTLLGQPAVVRFTPVGWHWNYGDGSAFIRATKGATWAAQGLHDFDRTATSHVYETEGEYVIRLTIDFRAEYRFGSSGFVPIPGTINLPANDLHVTVTGAKTVLVDHDCVANPAGPGC